MSWTEERLQDIWYGGREPGFALRGLSALYGPVVRLRRAAYRSGVLRTHRVGAPVIVVGNLVAGGSGKTPLVIALVQHLTTQGWKPGVVSRGYGRRTKGQRDVQDDSTPEDVGDEPRLIANRCEVPVVVDADRVAAARRAIARGCDVVIADDGLQHYRLHRDIEIEVIDGLRRSRVSRLLPAGPLREPLSRAEACDFHVVNGGEPRTGEWPMRMVGNSIVQADGSRQQLSEWRGRRVHAVAGIGHPQRFFDTLRAQGLDPVEHAFPDHHAYTAQDLGFAEALPVIATEKDWGKCVPYVPDAWMFPVNAELPAGFFDGVMTKLRSLRGNTA